MTLRPEVAISRGVADRFFIEGALQGTADAFVGEARTASAISRSGSGGFELADIDGSTLSPSSGTPYRKELDRATSLSVAVMQDLTPAVGLKTTVRLGTGETHYLLPEGSGILTDPIGIDFELQSVSGEVVAVWQGRCRGACRVSYAAGFGVAAVRARTWVQSALLDVRHESRHSDTYGVASVRLGLAPPGGRGPTPLVEGEVRVFDEQTLEARTNLVVAF
ncbi:hypothetical protein RNZ50_22025 [Paracoccaceae bacterium Fryx2]|nr:hypothetical protein [Paracoccaceae bacterium Fryx2]